MENALRNFLQFVGDHSAALLIAILIVLFAGMTALYVLHRRRLTSRDIAVMGLLVALNVVLSQLIAITIIPKLLILSLGFVPLALAGMLFGPAPAATVAVIGDILGALLFPQGEFYFGYTLTAFLTGLLYGLFLHKKELSVQRAALCQLLVSVFCYAILNSLWTLNWVSPDSALGYIATRLLVQPITYVFYLAVLLLLRRFRRAIEGALKL